MSNEENAIPNNTEISKIGKSFSFSLETPEEP